MRRLSVQRARPIAEAAGVDLTQPLWRTAQNCWNNAPATENRADVVQAVANAATLRLAHF